MLARGELQDGRRLEIQGKGEQVKRQAMGRILSDSLILCTFSRHLYHPYLAEIISAILGDQWSMDEVVSVGQRIMCQERLFNMREGVTRLDDELPPRLLNEPKPDGPTKGSVVPLDELKEDYYRAMGWDLTTGNPTDAVLRALGIEK
jgi:aldehyde:ferredoxin oxidoreductase